MKHVNTGIRGIRRIVADNKAGWHILADGEYSHYSEQTFTSLVKLMGAQGYMLEGVTGNGLYFTSVPHN